MLRGEWTYEPRARAFTYKLFVIAIIIYTSAVRVASTKPDLNISKVVFRLDTADT